MKIITYAIFVSLVSSCATNYKGPSPDFSRHGDQAKAEIKKFTLEESYWDQRVDAFYMDNKPYTSTSLEAFIKNISPAAQHKIEISEQLQRWWWLPYVGALAILIVHTSQDPNHKWDTGSDVAFWSLLGASLTIQIIEFNTRASAAEIYNKDLRAKFLPAISLRFQY